MSRLMLLAIGVCGSAAGAAFTAPAHAAPELRMEHAAARLVVIPEARGDVVVSVSGGDGRLPPLQVRREGNTVMVEGGLKDRLRGCDTWDAGWSNGVTRRGLKIVRVTIAGLGALPLDRLPLITARVPENAMIAADGDVWGEVGATDSLHLAKSGCGEWRVGPVRHGFTLANAGSGETHAQDVDTLSADLSGSGGLTLGRVAHDAQIAVAGSADTHLTGVGGALRVRVTGSGDVGVGEAGGPIDAAIRGSGDVKIDHGRSPSVVVNVAGSGDFTFGGEAGSLSAAVAGSGDVTVARVVGSVSKSIAGSGEVRVGR